MNGEIGKSTPKKIFDILKLGDLEKQKSNQAIENQIIGSSHDLPSEIHDNKD